MSTHDESRVRMIPVDRVRVVNPRARDKKKFDRIVENIAAIGLKKPITVTAGKPAEDGAETFDLVCGQGRLEAFIALGQKEIPALVRGFSTTDSLLASLIENIARRRGRATDQIKMIHWMQEQGHSHTDIAAKTGLGADYVKSILNLLRNGEERLLEAVLHGKIPITIAVGISGAPDDDAQRMLMAAYDRKEMTQKTLHAFRRIVDLRRNFGKAYGQTKSRGGHRTTAESLVRAYKTNDRRNILAPDRLNYDVLNHTDLSRDSGKSGDIELSHVNWGNYDLVVIDESHNFRNKASLKDRETRYDRLMRRVIKEGVKTRVLMLSATPVNNRLADLKNQISFVTEGEDTALIDHGITSIESTVRKAQLQFNRWLASETTERTPPRLIEMLGFDYFKLLDLLTIARSRRHIEKYYGTAETGKFPERLKPINHKPDVDRAGEFRSIRDINNEIRRLTLAAYAPLRYVLPGKQAAYDAKYSTQIRGGESFFRQVDREESLIHLIRVNVLKRMESAVPSFALTVKRQLADVEATLAKIEAHDESMEEIEIDDVDIDDPAFESMLVGRKVKVLVKDVDLVRWKQDLMEDRNRLATLYSAAHQVGAARDAKLATLREIIAQKVRNPLNPGNRKVIVFTAFADTAKYLYQELSSWAHTELGMHSALVTGGGNNQTTLPHLRKDLTSILTTFSPRSKERPADLAAEGEIDLLIATDCISEGQNLQDCDFLVNYDIHWNPVRIIQRFGRIDRIGSPNSRIQLVNFWPNIELEEYINLEQRVSGRMVLLDISATGEENIIEQQSGDQMNDLEYRRTQLLKLQDAVIDLEDLSSGVSIADLTLTDFRIDLAQYLKAHPGKLESLPLGTFAVTNTPESGIPAGVIFCLRAEGDAAAKSFEPGYPLAPHYLVHVGEDGAALLPFTQAKAALDRLKRICVGRDLPDAEAGERFDKTTKQGKDMARIRKLLTAAVGSVIGKKEERAVASLFTPGGTHAMKGEFAGINDFEVVAYLIILPAQLTTQA